MRTKSRDAVCLVFDEFELFDLAVFTQIVGMAGRHWNWRPFRVHLVGVQASSARSTSQVDVQLHHRLADSPDAEVLFIPGGYGARSFGTDAELLRFARHQADRAELVLSVAQGSGLLAACGVTDVGFAMMPAHQRAVEQDQPGATRVTMVDDAWHQDGKFISAKHSAGAIDASLCVIERTLGRALARKVAHELGILKPTLRIDLAPSTSNLGLTTGKKPK